VTDLPSHDHDPDPAALDELRRAFSDVPSDETSDHVPSDEPSDQSDEPSGDVTSGDDSSDHVTSGETSDHGADAATPGPIDPLLDVPAAGATGDGHSAIIRIDDYAGSTPADDATPELLVDAPTGTTSESTPRSGGAGEVISISDDDLPDAVYVEGSLDADGSGTIVFIEDDDSADVLRPESERDLRRGIEPRMRERRVAVKRAQSRRRLKRVAIVAGVVLLVVAILAILGSPLFAVRADDVELFGARYTDEQRLDEIIDDAVGTPVLRLDTDAVEAEIEAIPWVDEASVRVDFPHGLVIDIREREAWTTYQGPDGRFRVLDREGRVLDVLDMYPFAYVLIIGPDPVDLEAGDFAPQGYVAASELAKNLTGSMRGNVTQIEVTADGSRLAVHLEDGSTVLFGEARDLLAKLVRLEAVLANGEEREPGLIDVSTPDVTR